MTIEAPIFSHDLITRHALAHDASHFLVVPKATAQVSSAQGIIDVLRRAKAKSLPVTFRSGGTSLSGQATGGGLLVDIRRGFKDVRILDEGMRVSAEPGASLRMVNGRLARLGRRMGPDPASEIACTVGGVLANNSSGMACGTSENSYRTIVSAEIVLPSGNLVDTAHHQADRMLAEQEPALYDSLLTIRDRIRANSHSTATIQRLFSIKNTMGYGLNSFLDYDAPVDILLRLMVGSEGTLGFVARAVFKTVPMTPHALTGLLVFPSLQSALAALPRVVASGAQVAELLDFTSLGIARENDSVRLVLPPSTFSGEAALLVEYRAETVSGLADLTSDVPTMVDELEPLPPSKFSDDAKVREAIWKVRKGLFASVAAKRRSGELSILEDIAVPMEALFDTVTKLQELFARYAYRNAVIFGHAKDGNIHFLLNQSFSSEEDISRFEAFTADMVDLVLGNGGTLKAEHGTGRMMAPYVRRQYGDELFDVMVELKKAFDPEGILNPGVIISADPKAHIRNLKPVPEIEAEANKCVECGYCELVCPSKELTLTPRQRIVVRRDIAYASERGETRLARKLEKSYRYSGIETCAVDGMCQTVCPVEIDTGSLVRVLRHSQQSALRNWFWNKASANWSAVTRMIGFGLTLASSLPTSIVIETTRVARQLFGRSDIPEWSPDLPRGGEPRQQIPANPTTEVVLLASCTGSMFNSEFGDGSARAFVELCERAGVSIATLPNPADLCCGTPWSSKGLEPGLLTMRGNVRKALEESKLKNVVFISDSSSCTEGYSKLLQDPEFMVIDAVSFIAQRLESFPVVNTIEKIVLHPTCSTEKMGITSDLMALASHISSEVIVPDEWNCCGFAGDRGLLFPELTASASKNMADQLIDVEADAFASCNRTCEIALTRATGNSYANILEIFAHATR